MGNSAARANYIASTGCVAQYRFSVDIMQDRNNAERLLVCYQGRDCSSGIPWGYTASLQQVPPFAAAS